LNFASCLLALFINPEDGNGMFLQIIGKILQDFPPQTIVFLSVGMPQRFQWHDAETKFCEKF
jgi:hypothetical protein